MISQGWPCCSIRTSGARLALRSLCGLVFPSGTLQIQVQRGVVSAHVGLYQLSCWWGQSEHACASRRSLSDGLEWPCWQPRFIQWDKRAISCESRRRKERVSPPEKHDADTETWVLEARWDFALYRRYVGVRVYVCVCVCAYVCVCARVWVCLREYVFVRGVCVVVRYVVVDVHLFVSCN